MQYCFIHSLELSLISLLEERPLKNRPTFLKHSFQIGLDKEYGDYRKNDHTIKPRMAIGATIVIDVEYAMYVHLTIDGKRSKSCLLSSIRLFRQVLLKQYHNQGITGIIENTSAQSILNLRLQVIKSIVTNQRIAIVAFTIFKAEDSL